MNKVLHIASLPKPKDAHSCANRVLVSLVFEDKEYHIPVYEDGGSLLYNEPYAVQGNPESEASLFCLIANAIL